MFGVIWGEAHAKYLCFWRRMGTNLPQAMPSAALAQLVEHVIRNDGVVGSNPISGTISFIFW